MKRYIILGILALCLLLTACGGGQTSTQTPPPATKSTTQPSAAPTKTEAVKSEPIAETSAAQPEEPKEEPAAPQKDYTTPKKFSIEGKWKNVGTYTFGQVQSGSIVVFDGTNCNVFSPMDTYAFYKEGDEYKLDCTSFLFSDTLSFTVKIIDKEHINIYNGSNYLDMEKIS